MFLTKALEEINRASPRKPAELRESCAAALEFIKALQKNGSLPEDENSVINMAKQNPGEWDKLANLCVLPLILACETRQPKLMSLALDCFQVPALSLCLVLLVRARVSVALNTRRK